MAPIRRKGTGVAASPFNPVKLELAVLIVGGALLLVIHPRLIGDGPWQLLCLGAYGIGAMAWLVWRTRRVLARSGSR